MSQESNRRVSFCADFAFWSENNAVALKILINLENSCFE